MRGDNSGSVYVYVREGSGWVQQAKLTSPEAAEGQRFGKAVAIDGDTLVVGAASYPQTTNTDGQVYVFTRTGKAWSGGTRLVTDESLEEGDSFGQCATFRQDHRRRRLVRRRPNRGSGSGLCLHREWRVVDAASEAACGCTAGLVIVRRRRGPRRGNPARWREELRWPRRSC